MFSVARYPIAFVSSSSLQPRSTLKKSLYECLYGLCLYLLVDVRLAERNDVQRLEESSVGVLAFMYKRTSLVSNVMHSFRHALHINLHMFVCLQAVSSLKDELSMAQWLCWVPDVLCLLLRAILSHLCRPHPSSLAQP